jgi:pyruvate-formate lyase
MATKAASVLVSGAENLSKVCLNPLLSCFIDGCLEKGRHLTLGGARYKLLALDTLLMNGMSTAVDSLWAIRNLVFRHEALFTLPELVMRLICDWGYEMKEQFYSASGGEDRLAVERESVRHLRTYALRLPKFGSGNKEVDDFGRRLVRDLVDMAYDLYWNPRCPIAQKLDALRARYGTAQHPFLFAVTPGIATFEDYGGGGTFLGASADGRCCRHSVAPDFGPFRRARATWPSPRSGGPPPAVSVPGRRAK